MDSVSVTHEDIESITQAAENCTPAARDLLRALVRAIHRVAGGEPSVTVSVDAVQSMPETFDAAFTPEPAPAAPAASSHAASPHAAGAPAAGHGVHVQVMKITR